MTTSKSPLSKVKAQADRIAMLIKAFERGEFPDVQFAEKLRSARDQPSFRIGIAQDDKFISIDLFWVTVRATSEVALAAMILKYMRGETSQ